MEDTMTIDKRRFVFACGLCTLAAIIALSLPVQAQSTCPAATAIAAQTQAQAQTKGQVQSQSQTQRQGKGQDHTTPVVIPYPYLYQYPYQYPNNYPADSYTRLLDQYQQDTLSRIGQIQDDLDNIRQSVRTITVAPQPTGPTSAEVLRRLDSIERKLIGISARLNKVEQTVNMHTDRLRKMSTKIAEPNVVPAPAEPNAPRVADSNSPPAK
jgi:hypothetical protein